MIGVGRPPGRPAVQPARARRLLHRLPLVRLARPGQHLEQPARGQGRARARLHGRVLRAHVREPHHRRPPGAEYRSTGPEDEIIERYQQVAGPYTGRIRIGVSLFFALIAGHRRVVAVAAVDPVHALRQSFGIKDPQFHKDIGFYVFQLPFLQFIAEWLFAGSGDRADRHRGRRTTSTAASGSRARSSGSRRR